jgi:hypothetical protein
MTQPQKPVKRKNEGEREIWQRILLALSALSGLRQTNTERHQTARTNLLFFDFFLFVLCVCCPIFNISTEAAQAEWPQQGRISGFFSQWSLQNRPTVVRANPASGAR